MITRRQLLALSTATAAAAGLGVGGTLWLWWDQAPGQPHAHLSDAEASFLVALAEVAWPPTEQLPLGGAEASLDRFMDGTLGALPDVPRTQLRLLLHALDHAPLPGHLGTFQELPAGTRGLVLRGWLQSPLAELRAAASSLVVLLGMGFTTHPDNVGWFSAMYGCGYGR